MNGENTMNAKTDILDIVPVDPVTVEIIGNGLKSIANRITARMIRAAQALVIKEGEDCSSAIFDRNGQLLAESDTVPILRNAIGTCMQTILEKYYPLEFWKPGDVVLTNDPYAGGESFATAHTNDFSVIQPIFWEGRLVAFAGLMVHHLDVGSANMAGQGWNDSIYQEGLRIPPLKIAEDGKLDQKLLAVILNNTRLPEMMENDFTAQVACLGLAVPEVEDLFRKYGLQRTESSLAALIDNSEARTRAEIAKIPDGVYSNEISVMDDGTHGGPYWIRLKITKKGSDLTFDFTGTDKQVPGPINSPLACVWGTVLFAVRCLVDPSIPSTQGGIRPLTIIAPPGTLVNARLPAAVWQRMIVCQPLIDLIMGALSDSAPDRAMADSSGVQYNYITSRSSASSGHLFFGKNEPGGNGATQNADGANVVACHLNNCPLPGAETFEVEYPVLYLSREMRPDSGGAGQYRGGLGEILRYKVLAPELQLRFSTQKFKIAAQGRAGGQPGAPVRWVINEGTEREVVLDRSNGTWDLMKDDTITLYTPGGGGFGPVESRETKRIQADILAGLVTKDAAKRDYGYQS
jgi:N-methylhydantoinase B